MNADEPERERSEGQAAQDAQETPLLEWIMALVGAALIVAAVGFLLYEALTQGDEPPRVVIEVLDVTVQDGRFLVEFDARNTGDETGAGVTIEGQLLQGGEPVETSSVTLPYVPGHSTRKGGLFFTEDPTQYDLQIRALGYERP